MQESVIYQDILQKGLWQGELAVVVRLLTRRLEAISSEVRSLIQEK